MTNKRTDPHPSLYTSSFRYRKAINELNNRLMEGFLVKSLNAVRTNDIRPSIISFWGVYLMPRPQGVVVYSFTPSRLHGFTASRLHGFTPSRLHGFTPSRLHAFTASRLHGFTPSRLHGFTPSRLHAFTPSRLHAFTPSRLHGFTPSRLHASIICEIFPVILIMILSIEQLNDSKQVTYSPVEC